MKEKDLMKSLSALACVPQLLCTCADQTHATMLLNTCIACPIASILHSPLDEPSAKFCTASVVAALEDLHKVTASSWCNDLRDQVEHTRVLNVVYRSATALGSRLPSIASARERVAGAGALLRPVSSSTQVKLIEFVYTMLGYQLV